MPIPRHIEFIGAAGSGKSTLVPTAIQTIPNAKDYDEVYYETVKTDLSPLTTRFISRLPDTAQKKVIWMYIQLRNIPVYSYHDFMSEYPEFVNIIEMGLTEQVEQEYRQYVRHLLIKRAVRYSIVMNKESPVVFDEGFAMGAVSLCASKKGSLDQNLFHEYLRKVPCPDLLIEVKADLETCSQRIQERPEGPPSRVEDQTPEEWHAQLVQGANCVSLISDIAEQQGVYTININNDRSLDKTKRSLEQKLEELIKSGGN